MKNSGISNFIYYLKYSSLGASTAFFLCALLFLYVYQNDGYLQATSLGNNISTTDLSATGTITASKTGSNAMAITGTPEASATSSLVRLGDAISGGNANGTYIGANAASGFSGNFMDLQVGGTNKFKITSDGAVIGTATAVMRDPLGFIPTGASDTEKIKLGTNNGGFGGGATPGNITMSANDVTVFDTTAVNANSKGFIGGVFDGRYAYFVPYHNGDAATGQVTRYDTTGSFTSAGSWSVFNTTTVNANSKGFWGGVFDGRYVYLIPYDNGSAFGQVTRYDTTAAFDSVSSWSVFDTTTVNSSSKGFTGGVFDGRYVYLIPYDNGSAFGQVTRYDTTGTFTSAGSWSVFDTTTVNASSKGFLGGIFDGRYLYLIPFNNGSKFGQVTRYDTTGTFTSTDSWSVFNTATVNASSTGFSNAVFDGRYIYLVPYINGIAGYFGQVTRYDTTGTFTSTSSWSVYDTTAVSASSKGFVGATYDGRYVYFVPYNNGSTHGQVTRYDTTGPFASSSSWSVYNTATVNVNSKGFMGGVFDGVYIYLIPAFANGQVTRVKAWAGGVDSTASLYKLARSSEFFMDSAGNIGVGTTSPTALFHIASSGYLQFDKSVSGGTSTIATDCDANNERGRFAIDTSTNVIYVCNGATRGWDSFNLAD